MSQNMKNLISMSLRLACKGSTNLAVIGLRKLWRHNVDIQAIAQQVESPYFRDALERRLKEKGLWVTNPQPRPSW